VKAATPGIDERTSEGGEGGCVGQLEIESL